MNTQVRNSLKTHLLTILAVAMVVPWSVATADDLNPPLYRGKPLSVFAEWQLVPGSTILNLTQSNWVDDNDPSTTLHPLPFSNPVQPNAPGQYQFQLPNWIDKEPIKYMRVQLTWMGDLNPPISLASQALDGTNTIWGQTVNISPLQVDAAQIKAYQYYDLIFQPNPDFERVNVTLNPNSVLSQVVIDTVSTVPEPATMGLLGLGALNLLWRKRSAA
ncbi:MAG: PEP-CTERM sorting domain-containing protein [Planctomycetes bacterium]|nr:PEP-CTERM sorting domain-containing protein [Planctomycetota bacterium]